MLKAMVDTSTDPHTFRGRSAEKDGMCNEQIFRNWSLRELKIAKESNDWADLVKVLPESYQKSNEFSASRKCGQKVAADDRTTFPDKDRVRRIQTLGNCNKDAICHVGLRSSYVTISISKRLHSLRFCSIWVRYPLLLFLSVSFVLSLLCIYYICMLCRHV